MAKEKEEKVEKTESQIALEKIIKKDLSRTDKIENADQFSIKELQQIYQKMIDDYNKHLKEDDWSVKDLEKEEQRIIKIAEAWDNTLHDKIYTLSDDFIWNGVVFTRKQISTKILKILEKYECEYSYTLGMWQIAKWWMSPKAEIEFSVLDSTLRVLGNTGLKFKGPQEWENILMINEYFKGCNEQYTRDTLYTIMTAERHNSIVDELTLRKPQTINEEKFKETEAPQEGNIEMVEETK